MNLEEIESRWKELDPIFILGRQRTGTSIMWRALQVAGFIGFPEGHLWHDLIQPFAWWRDPEYKPELRQDIFTLGEGRDRLLEKQVALLLDRFHRDFLPPETVRWVNKSPGLEAVLVAPILAEVFPQAQFIFMQRNAITTVNSAIEYISKLYDGTAEEEMEPDLVFRLTCRDWVEVMEAWRRVRPLMVGRYIEVAQERIVTDPDRVAEQVADFLHASQWSEAFADVFKSRRENTAFPDRPVGAFFYPVDWTEEQKQIFTTICGPEMAVWGYPLDFQHPRGAEESLVTPDASDVRPLTSMTDYACWVRKYYILRTRDELRKCKDLLKQINEGRVMRTLNWLSKALARVGPRHPG